MLMIYYNSLQAEKQVPRDITQMIPTIRTYSILQMCFLQLILQVALVHRIFFSSAVRGMYRYYDCDSINEIPALYIIHHTKSIAD